MHQHQIEQQHIWDDVNTDSHVIMGCKWISCLHDITIEQCFADLLLKILILYVELCNEPKRAPTEKAIITYLPISQNQNLMSGE